MTLDLKALIRATKNTELILTPRLNAWLMKHGDDPVPKDIAQKVYEQLVKRPRNRTMSFSASAAGMCPRRQLLAFLGVPETGAIDPQLQNIFNDGKWRHLRWQTMLLQAGLLDDLEDPQVWRRMRSMGTMDGRGHVPEDHPRRSWVGLEYGFELKGVTPFLYPKFARPKGGEEEKMKEEHVMQVHRYFLMSGLDLFVIVYENKATQEWFEWVIEADDDLLEEQRDELAMLNDAVDKHRLPPVLPSCKAQIGPVFKECPYGGKNGPCLRAGVWPRLKRK